jgi:hypothetical protein
VFLECAVLGSTEVNGPNVSLLAAESVRMLAELLPEETANELFASDDENRDAGNADSRDATRSFLVNAFRSVGTAAARARQEPGFADIGAVAPTAASSYGGKSSFGFGGDAADSYAYAWVGSGGGHGTGVGSGSGGSGGGLAGSGSPRRGFASAQRTALETLSVLARAPKAVPLAKNKTDVVALEQTLTALARSEPNPSIAAAAHAAAQSVKGLLF